MSSFVNSLVPQNVVPEQSQIEMASGALLDIVGAFAEQGVVKENFTLGKNSAKSMFNPELENSFGRQR